MYRRNGGESKKVEGLVYEKFFKNVRIRLSLKPPISAYLPVQKHTSKVIKLTSRVMERRVGDSVITFLKNVEIGVKTADCVPVVIIGEIWVGVIHAGWRGLYKGIITETVKALREEGENRILAFVFPSAKSCCYEVGEEFKKLFKRNLEEKNGKLFFDPQEEAVNQLEENGVRVVEILRECTICNEKYPSYRRNRTDERIFTTVVKF